MGTYFSDTNLAGHIDQHRRPEPREFSILVNVGDRSADFQTFATIAEHGLLVFRRAYFIQPTGLQASAASYWTIKIIQHDEDGREIDIAEHDGSRFGIVADKPLRIPAQGNLNKPLLREMPLFVKGTKSGTPSATNDLFVQVVVALR